MNWDYVYVGESEVTYARGRKPDRTYASRCFTLRLPASRDHGQPARFVTKVFDDSEEDAAEQPEQGLERTNHVIESSPAGRSQITLMVAREAGEVREIVISRVPSSPTATKLQTLLKLNRTSSARLIELIKSLDYIPVEGDEQTVRIDDDLIREVFSDPHAARRIYDRDPDTFRELVEEDPLAGDLVAIAHRREVVSQFRRLMTEESYFEDCRRAWNIQKPGMEPVWQYFFEMNPWILGVNLTGQLLTSWSHERLEQVVAGFSVGHDGKRVDALLRTSGQIRSLVFAEIKHHDTPLLQASEYRSACWAPSLELAGGVTQIQQTVAFAARDLGGELADKEVDGSLSGTVTYLVRPRSYLVIGHLNQLKGANGGVHPEKFQSFELYRRNLYEPDIVTFDELLIRAEWLVEIAEAEKG